MYPSTLEWTLVKTQYGALIEFLDELGVMDFHYAETRVEEFLLALTKYMFSSLILDVPYKFQQVSQVFLNFHNFLPETKVFSSSVPQENPQ